MSDFWGEYHNGCPDTNREHEELVFEPKKPEPVGYITRDCYEHMQEGLTGGYISRKPDRLFCVALYAEVRP